MTANKKITPTDLRQQAQQLIDSGRMPSLDEVLQAVCETRRKYTAQILAVRADTTLRQKVSDLFRSECTQHKNSK